MEGIIKGEGERRKEPRIVNFFGLPVFGVFVVSMRMTLRDLEVGDGERELISMDFRETVSRILGLEDGVREGLLEGIEERLREIRGV